MTRQSPLSTVKRFRIIRKLALSVCAFGLIVAPTATLFGQLPSITLSTIYPPGAKQGATLDVTITGSDLDEVSKLVFSNPGIVATQKMVAATDFKPAAPVPNQFSLKIDPKVSPGIYEARLVGRFGISNPRSFEVGRFDDVQDDGSNKTIASAKEFKVGTTMNGRIDAGSRDYFKLAMKQGQRILIDCAAERIDSRMDGTLVIYNDKGTELARNRDANGRDPLLDFTAPAEGQYIIGLYDFVYAGGAEHYYRLSVHSGPYIDFIMPPAGLAGSNGQYTIYGRNLPGGQPDMKTAVGSNTLEKLTVNINLPADEASKDKRGTGSFIQLHTALIEAMDYQLNTPQGASNPVTISYARAPLAAEVEPNNSAETAQKITVPCDLAGQFYPARDVDWLQFDGKKGDVYWIEVISHRLGVESDPYFLLQRVTKNDKGEEQISDVANIDDPGDRNTRLGQDYDTSTDDPIYRFQVPQDATYRIAVRDQFNTSGADARRVYRLVIRKDDPDFHLIAMQMPDGPVNNNQVNLLSTVIRKGGSTLIDIRVERLDNFDGDIDITVEGLPNGVTCPGASVSGNVNTASLVISAAENAAGWSGPFRIVGKAKIGDKEIVRKAIAGCAVWNTANRQQDPPQFRMMRDLALAVIDKETAIAQVDIENKVWETSRGGKLEIPIKVTRRGDFKADVTLAPLGTPNEIKPKNVVIKGNVADGKLLVEATNNATKPGIYTFCLKSDVKFKYPRNTDAIKQAEEEQKRLDALLKDFQAKQKTATDAKTAALKAATDAANLLKTAQQAKAAAETEAKNAATVVKQADDKLAAAKQAAAKDTANEGLANAVKAAEKVKTEADGKSKAAIEKLTAAQKALTETEAKSKTADAAKVAAEKTSADLDAKVKTATTVKQAADKDVTTVKNANKVADRTVSLYSSPIKLRIVDSPVDLTTQAPGGALKQGEKVEIPVTIARKYGFDDAVQVLFEPPKGVALTIKALNIAKDQTQGKLEVTAAKNATPGEHTVTIRARAKFNNVSNLDTTQQIVVKVEKVEAAK